MVVTTQTDDIDRYIVPNLVPGTYQVVALNPNFQAQTKTISLNPDDIAAVNFALLANPADLTGMVIDEETRQPIVGALVEVFDEFGVSIAFGLTDQNGEYLIQGLPQGIFTVRASAPGYLSETASADLGAGENVLNFELRRVPESSSVIAGTVTDSISGAPITGVRIDLNNSRGEFIGFTFTDSNGQYYFQGLEPGTYNISASAEGYLEAQLTLTLEAGESDLNANISLIRASGLGSIRGQVRNAKNNLPIASARVEILNSQGVLVAAVSTDSSGFFEVQGLLPGRYTVRASASLYITGSTEAVVNAGGTTNVTLFLTMALASLSGTVTDEKNGKPIPCALISAFNHAVKLKVFGKTNENGKYIITALVPGTYTVRVSAKGYLTETVTVTLEPGESLVLDFQLKPLKISKAVIIGKVYDKSTKKPIKGAKVELLTCNGKLITFQKTNKKGIYHFKDLPQGKYILIVRSKGYQKEKKKVNLCNGHSILEVNFYLNATDYFGTIKGKVKGADNKSKISNALIEVFNESGEKIATTYTDNKGKYKIKTCRRADSLFMHLHPNTIHKHLPLYQWKKLSLISS
ncbi:hypothetical protein FOA20_24445 [Peribacillus simplex]